MKKIAAIEPPPELFHYTSQAGLLGIIEGSTIWTTKIQYLNDSSEYKLARDIAKNIIKRKIERTRLTTNKIIYNLLKEQINNMAGLNTCVCSFSKTRDLLSQWRGYGEGIGGYAIGFNSSNLINQSDKQYFSLLPCIYDEKKQEHLLKKVIENGLRAIKRAINPSDLDDPEKTEHVTSNFSAKFAGLAPIIKNKKFSEEQEWRLISKWGISAEFLEFRPGIATITPYYDFHLGSSPNEYFRKIVIGPCPHPELAESALRMLLRKHELSRVRIIQSEIPYRNM